MSRDTAREKGPQSVQNVERKSARITSNTMEIGFLQKLQHRVKRNGGQKWQKKEKTRKPKKHYYIMAEDLKTNSKTNSSIAGGYDFLM